ncbi:LacI family transcriptional regulator [Mesorhizobium xinjiangense]|uniref:LacI family transcriptional regulator n=1 Tax=Mesorhizobium xinjiangense TaxID=2678685 RepID=UPI0012EE4178|nr:LacI family transcriptional regulator [Mesorhizobium xinjiangense]
MDKKTKERSVAAPAETGLAEKDGQRPTLKTIAFMTGLGVTTVSRALKDAPEIGEATRRRVQLVARQIGYRPNRAGVRLRTGKTNVISLILNTEDEVTGFLSDIIYGISEALADTPYHLVVTPYSRTNDPLEPVRYVVETGSADGIIISRTEPDDPRVRYMVEHDFPFATHGRTAMGVTHPFHDYDNHAYAAQAVRTLVGAGRRKLALLPPPPFLTYYNETRNGFSEGLLETGASEAPFPSAHLDLPLDRIRALAADLMCRKNRPDGIVSSGAGATIALVAGIEEAGLELGHDVDIVSKQSTQFLHWFRRQIFIAHEDFTLAGRDVARALIKRIGGARPETLQAISRPVWEERPVDAAGGE